MTRKGTLLAALIAVVGLAQLSWAEEAPKTAHIASQAASVTCQCNETESGARPGEDLDARWVRFERQWRITNAERKVVNAQAVRRRK